MSSLKTTYHQKGLRKGVSMFSVMSWEEHNESLLSNFIRSKRSSFHVLRSEHLKGHYRKHPQSTSAVTVLFLSKWLTKSTGKHSRPKKPQRPNLLLASTLQFCTTGEPYYIDINNIQAWRQVMLFFRLMKVVWGIIACSFCGGVSTPPTGIVTFDTNLHVHYALLRRKFWWCHKLKKSGRQAPGWRAFSVVPHPSGIHTHPEPHHRALALGGGAPSA